MTLIPLRQRVSDSSEGRWTIKPSIEEGVPAPVLTSALYERFSSGGNADHADRFLSARRCTFGGHAETNVKALEAIPALTPRSVVRGLVPRLSIAGWRGARLAHGDLRRAARRGELVALAGGAVLHSGGYAVSDRESLHTTGRRGHPCSALDFVRRCGGGTAWMRLLARSVAPNEQKYRYPRWSPNR